MGKRDLQRAVMLALRAGAFERHSEREMVAKLGIAAKEGLVGAPGAVPEPIVTP
jgi:hypothetical protein